MVRRVVLNIFSKSTGSQFPGTPLSTHTGGALGTVALVPKNSHVPASMESLWKYDAGSVNPLPVIPGAKSSGGIASPRGERTLLRRE